MRVTKRNEQLTVSVSFGGVILKKVNSFKYLRTLVDGVTRCDRDIRARIGMAKSTFGQLRKILVNLRTCVVIFAVWMLGLDNQ